MKTQTGLSGRQKAAILLISLGPEVSAQVFKQLREDEVEKLTLEIARVRQVTSEDKELVMDEFHQMALANEYISQGGIHYAREILEKALGKQKAVDVLNRLTSTLHLRPFDFARKADPSQILNFIQNENPQMIALILSYLDPEKASLILSSLPGERQADVARRIALMDRTSPEVISQVEHVLEQKLSATSIEDYSSTGGVDSIVAILNGVDRGTEKTILDALAIQDVGLAEEIKKKMFVFEDIVNLDNRSIQRVIRDIENQDLQLALKASSEDVKEVIYRNMSNRMAETFKEEIQYMGPVRLRDVEEAQGRIVGVIRKLEEGGEIIISRGGGEMKLLSKVYKHSSLERKTTEVKILQIPRFSEILVDSEDELLLEDKQDIEKAESVASKVISDAEEIAEQIIEQAKQEISLLQTQAEQEIAEKWQQNQLEWKQALEQAKAEGYQAGLKEGKIEGQRIAQSDYQVILDSAKEVLDQAYEDKESIITEAETFLITLSSEISKKVIGQTIELQPKLIINTVKETLERVKERESVSICVHPCDYHVVQAQRQQFMTLVHEHAEVKVYPDQSIGQGGCIIRTSQGSLDARIDTQLSEIRNALMELIKDERNK